MLKAMLCVGVSLTCGSAAVGYDYHQKAALTPDEVLSLSDYLGDLNFGAVDLMAQPPRERIASLPQIQPGLAGPDIDRAPQSTEEQIDDFVKDSPQLKAMLEADRAASKERWWSRLFRKADKSDAPRTNRLTAIRERNFPTPKQGLDPSAIDGMSATELYSNRARISQGFTNSVANSMNAMGKIDF